MSEQQPSEAKAIIETVERLSPVQILEIAPGVKVADIPSQSGRGRSLESIKKLVDEYRTAPERRKGTAMICEPHSFVEHVNRNKDTDSVLFACADRKRPSVTAVYDYNKIDGSPRFGSHRAHYPFPLSTEWEAWVGKSGFENRMKQAEFAEFIEDRLPDLAQPTVAGERTRSYAEAIQCEFATPTQVANLSRELSIRVEQNVTNQVKLSSGEAQLTFREEHKDQNGAPVKVPGAFLIQIPIFEGGLQAVLPVRLRYRVLGTQIVWFYELALVDALFKQAIDEEIKKIQAGVELPVYVGTPEV